VFLLIMLGASPHSAYVHQTLPFCSMCQCGGEISRHIYCPSCFPTPNAATCMQLIISIVVRTVRLEGAWLALLILLLSSLLLEHFSWKEFWLCIIALLLLLLLLYLRCAVSVIGLVAVD
jgi:hypothetical protein